MAITATKALRFTAGLAVSIGVLLALDLLPWRIDVAGLTKARLYAELGITAGIVLFVAAFAGAVVARVSFIVPSLILAAGAWLMAADFLSAVSRAYGPDNVVLFVAANSGGLSLAVCGSLLGAMLGKRYSTDSEARKGGAQ